MTMTMAFLARGVKAPRVGHFELHHELGKGGYGRVLMAIDLKRGETVAAKELDTGGSLDRKKSIAHEIKMLRRLDHPGVVGLRGFDEVGKLCYIFMEFAAGGDLFELVLARGRLSEAEARPIFAQTISAVAHLHERGVVHRDIKLENIVVTADGNAKLCDFGLAHAYERRPDSHPSGAVSAFDREPLTRVCGSESYMAPEVPMRRGYDGPATDVWSCGVVLFGMLTGSFPFDAANEGDWRYRRVLDACAASPDASVCRTIFDCFEGPCLFSKEAIELTDAQLRPFPAQRCTAAAAQRMAWVRLPRLQLRRLLRTATLAALFTARRAVLPSGADSDLSAFDSLRIASSTPPQTSTLVTANGKLPDLPSRQQGRAAPTASTPHQLPATPAVDAARLLARGLDEACTLDKRLRGQEAGRGSQGGKTATGAAPPKKRGRGSARLSLSKLLMPSRRAAAESSCGASALVL